MNVRWKMLLCSFLVACAATAADQPPGAVKSTQQKIAVSVDDSSTDEIGHRLVLAVKEAIRGSQAYRLVPNSAVFRVGLTTIGLGEEDGLSGHATSAAYVFSVHNTHVPEEGNPQTSYPLYLTSGARAVGKNAVSDAAIDIVKDLDSAVSKYMKDCPSNPKCT